MVLGKKSSRPPVESQHPGDRESVGAPERLQDRIHCILETQNCFDSQDS